MNRLSSEVITLMRQWTRENAASRFDSRAREIESEIRNLFVEIGLICVEVEDRKLYESMSPAYDSFDRWLMDAMPTQRSTAYAARSAMRALKGILAESEMCEIPRCNLETLGKCSTDVARDPLLVQKAKTLSQNEFVRAVQHDFPTQHLEERDPYRFTPTKSQRETIDAAISAVRVLMEDEAISREECLFQICREFVEDREEVLKVKVSERGKHAPVVVQ